MSNDRQQGRTHRQMGLEIRHLETMIGWQQVPSEEIREQRRRAKEKTNDN